MFDFSGSEIYIFFETERVLLMPGAGGTAPRSTDAAARTCQAPRSQPCRGQLGRALPVAAPRARGGGAVPTSKAAQQSTPPLRPG